MTSTRGLNTLLIGGWVDQAFTFLRSFARQEEINLFIADCWPNSSCRYSRHCRGFHLVPMYEDPEYAPTVLEICKKEQIEVVLPVHHEDLIAISKRKELFDDAGVRVPIPSPSLIELANDKYRMVKLAEKSGISAPQTHLLSEVEARDLGRSIELPALVKLRNSTGQRGQKRIRDAREFETQVQSLLGRYDEDEIIIQEYIPGTVQDTMYTVGLIYNHKHELRACVPLKKIRSRPYTGGTAICTRAENQRDVREMAIELMSSLGKWQGIADVEIKIAPDGRPVFIELNPRPWGSMYGAYAAGVDLPMYLVKVALGEDFAFVDDFNEGFYASFLSRDLALLSGLIRKLLTPERGDAWKVLSTYARPYLLRNKDSQVSATSDFVLDDLGPFFRNLGRFLKLY